MIGTFAMTVVDTLLDVAPYLLAGFFFAGLLKAFVSEKTIVRHVGASSFRSVLNAALIGTPMPLCSCSVIPVATAIRKNGASKGATTSFLISTPESGVDSIAVSYALLDPLMTVFRPVAAFASAVLAGWAENILGKPGEIAAESSCACDHCGHEATPASPAMLARIRSGLRYAFTDLLQDIAYYLVIGLLISAIIASLLPIELVQSIASREYLSMFIMLLIGIPVYVCATASTPVAAALILKGISPGAALVFLLVGPATNLATIGVVKKTLGGRSLILYLASIMLVALLMGSLLNGIYAWIGTSAATQIGSAAHILPDWIRGMSALVLAPLLFYGTYKEIRKRLRR